ncbi:hypothetical protein [Limnoglobus roseus]|uniref:Uncharacterized protein n=1 Tax=Limnoglobus roseus TaxID=2598579 RepID=A0A5C1AMG8_9BACT|nr:hypothetical protein [Limnoglobus roseus]QEL20441.1 hypothetical protein PX52LOC_07539 [Limnoglobus roseus]
MPSFNGDRRDDYEPRPRTASPNNGLILAGLVAGLSCGVVVLLGLWMFRQPQMSQERLRAREQAEEHEDRIRQYERAGVNNIGEAGRKLVEQTEEEERQQAAGENPKPKRVNPPHNGKGAHHP